MDTKELGKRIKEKRCSEGLTQEQLAEYADVSVTYIGMLERGKRMPRLETFVRIADVLNATADELLCGMIKKGCLERLAKYAEEMAKLNLEEKKRIYTVMDALLDMQ